MEFTRVAGQHPCPIKLYALSTCVWCRKTKALLNELSLGYEYVDVDLLDAEEKERTEQEIARWNPACSFPTLVIGDERCIAGFQEDRIRELVPR